MPRAKRGFKARRRRNRVLKWAKGFRGKRKNCHAIANESVQHAWMHMYRSRKVKKRDFRALWIQRINAAVREHGLTYGRYIDGLAKAGITVDRKVLAEIAVKDAAGFKMLCDQAAAQLKAA
jgi:large subunit ribosomal protein L20